jgi:hypothetical protein
MSPLPYAGGSHTQATVTPMNVLLLNLQLGYETVSQGTATAPPLPCEGDAGCISGACTPGTAAQNCANGRELNDRGSAEGLAQLTAELRRLERIAQLEKWGFPAGCAVEISRSALRLFTRQGV